MDYKDIFNHEDDYEYNRIQEMKEINEAMADVGFKEIMTREIFELELEIRGVKVKRRQNELPRKEQG